MAFEVIKHCTIVSKMHMNNNDVFDELLYSVEFSGKAFEVRMKILITNNLVLTFVFR